MMQMMIFPCKLLWHFRKAVNFFPAVNFMGRTFVYLGSCISLASHNFQGNFYLQKHQIAFARQVH